MIVKICRCLVCSSSDNTTAIFTPNRDLTICRLAGPSPGPGAGKLGTWAEVTGGEINLDKIGNVRCAIKCIPAYLFIRRPSYTPRTKLKHYVSQYLSTISTSVQNFYHTEAKSWLILVLLNWKNPDWIFLRSCLELSFILRVYQSRWCAVFRHFHIFPFSPCKKRPQRIIDDSLTVVESFKKQLSIFMRGGVLLATLGDPTFTRMTWIWHITIKLPKMIVLDTIHENKSREIDTSAMDVPM